MWKKINISLFLLLLLSCSFLETGSSRNIRSIRIIRSINTSFSPRDCCYSPLHNTVFVLENASNYIHIYSSTGEKNKIGGLGYGNTHFNRLTDITLSPDANLLALDSFKRVIKKFDRQGSWIIDIELKNYARPTFFAVSNDGTYFIYDAQKNEVISTADFSSYYNFGKFQLAEPDRINLVRDKLHIYERKEDKSLVFSTLGQFEEERSGNVQFLGGQALKLERYYLSSQDGEDKFAINPNGWKDFIVEQGYIYLLAEDKVVIAEPVYE